MQEDELTLNHKVPITCFNESPLHAAAMKGHVDFAKALLQHKPDTDTELDSRGHFCNLQVFEYVVSTSTELKINRVNKKGFTALDVIEQMPKDLKTRQVHELLVEAGTKRGGELSATGQDTNQLRPIEVDEISTPLSAVPAQPPSLSHPKSQEKIKKIK
ncbi:hypothetical protein LguiA_005296 [Lonicera macranthoides]